MPHINDLLRDHVTLEVECLDRIYPDHIGTIFLLCKYQVS